MQCEWSHNAQWQLVILELRNNVINVYIVKKKKKPASYVSLFLSKT